MQMWHFRTWFSRHAGGVGLTVARDDLRGLFQPVILGFCDSVMILWFFYRNSSMLSPISSVRNILSFYW